MTSAFIVNLDVDSIDPTSLSETAEELHTTLDEHFDVVDVKPYRQPPSTTPPVSGGQPQPPVR